MAGLLQKLANEISGKRAMTVLVIVILSHISLMLYHIQTNRQEHDSVRREEVIQKIMNIIFFIEATPYTHRPAAITSIADPDVHVSLTAQPIWPSQFSTVSFWPISRALRNHAHSFAISIQMAPDQWFNLTATLYSHVLLDQLLLLTLEVIVLISIFMAAWAINRFTQPLKQFKEAAEQLGLDLQPRSLSFIAGPLIVREAAEAMHKMQARIKKLIHDRTQMLAAISHDLRTPITRMKLRTQFIEDIQLQNSLTHDLDEMEKMINEILAFTQEDLSQEREITIDLVSLLETITHETQDMNESVSFSTTVHRAPILGKSLALKRAFTNLIHNGVRYGDAVTIQLKARRNKGYVITITDEGPGIPDTELEHVFEPFYRLEHSRSRHTGGAGLGLTVARDILRAHGAKITLRNRKPQGLSVVIEFF